MGEEEDFFVPARTKSSRPVLTPEEEEAELVYFRDQLFRAINVSMEHRMRLEQIAKTFEEMGIKAFRPMRRLLLVRTEPIPQKIGLIYVPPKLATFYGELPHLQNIYATVLAAGPKAEVAPGDRVVFSRLYFARWQTMEDGTVVGWIEEANVYGRA